jgi:ABC-type branched-subunit amino acid transport system ATPase component/branched-subunit amino acid ABC-type transport system permease component
MYALQLASDGLFFTAALILLGQGIVVVHRGSGVINFAAAAIGVVGAYVFYNLWPGHGLPWPLALVIAVGVSSTIGAATQLLVMGRLRRASLTTKVIATLAVMTLLGGLGDQFLAPNGLIRTAPSFLPAGQFHVSGKLSVTAAQIIVIGIALAVSILLLVMQKRTRFGLATSAVCENPEVAAGMGWSPDVIAAANWALGCGLAALAVILIAPVSGLTVDSLTLLVVPALGAALIGQFESYTLTLLGALVIGIGEAEVGMVTTQAGWAEAAPLLVIIGVLLIRRPAKVDRSHGTARLPVVGSGRIGPGAVAALLVCFGLVAILSPSWLNAFTTSVVLSIALLSIVVLTGYAGQLSLAQFGLAGIGAFVTAWAAAGFGLPLWAAMLVAVVVTVPVGMAVAVPAFRTRGVALAIATLSLVVVIDDLLLNNPGTASWMKSGALPPLELFGFQFDQISHPQRYSVFALIVAALVAIAVANLRRSSMGRRLLAIRANPQAASSLGISPVMAKVYAFAIAAAMAAICGSLLEAQLAYADFGLFGSQASIQTVLSTTVGGIGFIPGAFTGAAGVPGGIMSSVLSLVVSPSNWVIIVVAALTILVLLQSPDGVIPLQIRQFRMQRAMIGQVIARRRGRADPATDAGKVSLAAFFGSAGDGWLRSPREDAFARARRSGSGARQRRIPAQLDVEALSVVFGGVRALDAVSLTVSPGEIVGLIGPNGAGKTTFIDAVTGFVTAAGGSVRLDNASIDSLSSTRRADKGLARSFQSLELFEDMTVGENLLVASEAPTRWQGASDLVWPRRPRTNEAAALAVRDFELEPFLGMVPRGLDHGKRRQVAIARAFAADPALILLDEPAAGLDTKERAELGALIRKVASEWNIGVLLVEHDVNLVFQVCDRVFALVQGRVVAAGTPRDVRRNPEVIEAYLGHGAESDQARGPDGDGPIQAGADSLSESLRAGMTGHES